MAVERSNPVLDTLGVTGLKREGFYGAATQFVLPLVHKIHKEVRTETKDPKDVSYREMVLEFGDFAALISVLALAAANLPAAILLKLAYNLGANVSYDVAFGKRKEVKAQ